MDMQMQGGMPPLPMDGGMVPGDPMAGGMVEQPLDEAALMAEMAQGAEMGQPPPMPEEHAAQGGGRYEVEEQPNGTLAIYENMEDGSRAVIKVVPLGGKAAQQQQTANV
jgi:hypothetical protein